MRSPMPRLVLLAAACALGACNANPAASAGALGATPKTKTQPDKASKEVVIDNGSGMMKTPTQAKPAPGTAVVIDNGSGMMKALTQAPNVQLDAGDGVSKPSTAVMPVDHVTVKKPSTAVMPGDNVTIQ